MGFPHEVVETWRREPRVSAAVRAARTCYDHLAGVAGVELCDALLERGWIAPAPAADGPHQPGYRLTDAGRAALADLGVEIPSTGSRRFAYACADWTERRPHVGGALGAAILARMAADGAVGRMPGTRAVTVTTSPREWLGRA